MKRNSLIAAKSQRFVIRLAHHVSGLLLVLLIGRVTCAQPLDTRRLLEIESRALPPALVEGPGQHGDLSDYYKAANPELAFRLSRARQVYESGESRPFRMVTLIAGDAGVGKTFIKRQIFSKGYGEAEICKFDVRDLYQTWETQGKVQSKPDLYCKDTVLCSLPALKSHKNEGLLEYLQTKKASFYVIDSLDEVHPADYVHLLDQVERFVFRSNRPFTHVVVLGRGFAFRDYWAKTSGHYSTSRLNLFVLECPEFRTTGDLLVSGWNYHCFAHKLRWKSNSDSDVMLSDFQQWSQRGFSRDGRLSDLTCTPEDAINARCESALREMMTTQRYPQVAFRNLAGNGFMREIVAQHVREGQALDKRSFAKAYLEKWMVRDTKSGDRPSVAKPEHLGLYLSLLEELAARVLREDRLDSQGFFWLDDDEMISQDYRGDRLQFPAHLVLNRSGLKHHDPRTPGVRRYRFEPFWLHELLVDSYNKRRQLAQATSVLLTQDKSE